MKRSKELFEYLSQHGMYTRQSAKADRTEAEGEPDRATRKPEPEPERPPTEAKRARRPRPARKREVAASGSKASFADRSLGDRMLVVTYNNVAVSLLFVVALLVLAYFLGFSQGVGDFDGREYQLLRMNSPSPPSGAGETPSIAAGAAGAVDPEEAPDGNQATRAGFLEGQKVYWSVRAYTASPRNRRFAEDHLNDLLQNGYDARIATKGDEVRLYVDRFDDPEDPAIDKLVDELREWKRQYPDTREVVYPFESAFREEIRP
jgi:hypothetical protein